jgi:hypothetical protein
MIVANHVRRVPRSLILHARREPRQHRARVAVERVERDRRRRIDRLERRARPRILAAPRREIALVEIIRARLLMRRPAMVRANASSCMPSLERGTWHR